MQSKCREVVVMSEYSNENLMRLSNAVVGALAGVSFWLLVEVLPDALENEWLFLWIGSVVFGFFALLLGLVGPLKPREALGVAFVQSLTAASLLYWASLRFYEVDDVFEVSFDALAYAVLIFIGAPFGAAVMRGKAFDYAYLFDTAWGIVVRYLAAWVFVGLFWAALFLSHALLEIVGISLIWDLVEEDIVPYLLTGCVLGLALAVANELRAYVSPYLLLRLLRLLMPPLVLVVAVFILALPFRGLSGLFGEFSAAGTLMAVAIAGASLIAAAVDSTDEEAVGSAIMRLATRAFAAMLPVLGVLAVWAVVIRVNDYGWTPVRLAAFVAALFVLAYGVLYGLALVRSDWMTRIRRANIYHALAVLFVAALWLTPVLDSTRVSAISQLARYLDGRATLDQTPIWELEREWGRAGKKAIAALLDVEGDAAEDIAARIERAQSLSSWEFRRDDLASSETLSAEIIAAAVVFPGGALSVADFSEMTRFHLTQLHENCTQNGCVFIVGDLGANGTEQMIAFEVRESEVVDVAIYERVQDSYDFARSLPSIDTALFEEISQGNFKIAPSRQQSVWVGDTEIGPGALSDQFVVRPIE
jgi:hypothetical protein